MLKIFLTSVLLFVFYLSDSVAENPEAKKDTLLFYNLTDVIITANKYFTPSIEVPHSVSLITRQDIERKQKVYLADLLRSEIGLSIAQQGGSGKLSRVFLRGANPHHTLFLVDGIEMNNPGSLSNAYDLSSFQTDNIERIEILRGPQSTLYGSDAMAGVISIFTSKGEGRLKLNMNTEYGSFNTFKSNALLSGSLNSLHYAFNVSGLTSDGISSASEQNGNQERDFNKVLSGYTRLGYDLTNNIYLDVIYNFTRNKAGLDQNERLGDDPNFEYYQDESVFKAAVNLKLLENLWEQSVSVSGIKVINKTTDETDAVHPDLSSENYFTGDRLKFEWQNVFRLTSKNNLLFGFDFENEKGYSSYTTPFYSSVFPSSLANIAGLYIQEQLKIFNTLSANAGIRYDKSNKFGSQVTFRLAPAYFIQPTMTKIKFTYGTGFKAPSLYYLLDPMYGNKDLKPEKSQGWDAGFEQFLLERRLSFGVTYFRNDFTNLIGYNASFQTVNIDKAETKGVELLLNLRLNNLSIECNYTASRNTDKSNNLVDGGKDLIRRPRNKGAVLINYSLLEGNINLESIFTGRREDKEFLPDYSVRRVELKAYTLVNLALSYKIYDMLRVSGKIENIFDEEYEDVLFYGTPGRTGYISFNFSM